MKKAFKSVLLIAITTALLLGLSLQASASVLPVSLGTTRYMQSGGVPAAYPTSSSVTADVTVNDYNSLIAAVVRRYVARDADFSIRYNGATFNEASEIMSGEHIWDDIFSCDLPDTNADLDYLRFNMRGTMKVSGWSYGTYAVFEFNQGYYTTAEQEAYVDKTVAEILGNLKTGARSQAGKVRAIHDYITGHVEYDTSLTRFSAYDALYSKRAVCNGYMLLMYKMLSEAGVPVRAISGVGIDGGTSQNHAWNIVKIGQYWYNIDATWDDTGRTDEYYLKSSAAFSDHVRDSEYATAAFTAEYPISPADFDPSRDEPAADANAPSAWAKDGILSLKARGVVPAALFSDYRNAISRGEFTALMVNVYEYAKGKYSRVGNPPFTDIKGSPYSGQIAKGYELGIIAGTGPETFEPDGTLTREQCAKIISNTAGLVNGGAVVSSIALPFGDASSIQGWAVPYVRYAYENKLMAGDGVNFIPAGYLTREQAMAIAERMIEKYAW